MGNGKLYAPAARLEMCRSLLRETGGMTVYEIADRLGVSVATARRYIRALIETEAVYGSMDGRRKVWRLVFAERKSTIRLTPGQMVALSMSRRVFDPFEGTGFKESLDEVFAQLEATLKHRAYGDAANVGRKFFDANEGRYDYARCADEVNAIITALLRGERLRVRHRSRSRRPIDLDPYTLIIYKQLLYLAAYSHEHQQVRTFAVDELRDVEWLRGKSFDYPDDWDPAEQFRGAFGLFTGPETTVRIRFRDPELARRFQRRRRHRSQSVRRVRGGVEVTMRLHVSPEFTSWLLGFGHDAEVLSPAWLRERIGGAFAQAARVYGLFR